MSKYLVKELKAGDIIEIKVPFKVSKISKARSSLHSRNGTRSLRNLEVMVSDGFMEGKFASCLVEETDRIEMISRRRRTMKELWIAFWNGKKKKGKS